MRSIVASDVVAASKFNRFHLLVFLWCFYAIGFDGYDIAMYGVGLPWMMEEWNISSVQAGAVGSYSLFGMLVGALILAPVADKLGRKNVIVLCMFLFSVFTLGAGLAPNITWFTVMRFTASIGMGGLMPNAISLMTEYSPKKNRAFIVAIMYVGYALGGIMASLIGMYIVPHTDWRMLYYIGIIPLITLPLFMKQFPESITYYLARKQVGKVVGILNKVHPTGNYKETDDYKLKEAEEGAKGSPVKKLFTDKRAFSTVSIWIAVFCTLMMAYGLNTWLPKMMQDTGFSITSSLSFNLVLCVGQILGSVVGGYLAEKIGHRKILVSLFFLGAITFVALSMTSNVIALYFLIAIGGACTVGAMNLGNPYITEYYPRAIRATGIGYAQASGRIGSILAPTLIAMLMATGMNPNVLFATFAVPSLIAALGYILIQEKYGSFDKLVEEDNEGVETKEEITIVP
ncbi:MFS transporter [Priestia filamentosa]|uniref:MFS transporter n=1 Tax=Priestia filamentosa TaxID=1402861 RepID=UPI000A087D6E|nr:MFS transporter [Priestia filamentosa]MDT3761976.1 MFS transporter [Priestia filamentosa]OXS68060.1 MFS transporter [Priestia filamentosa]RJS64738.1 MFS transporter [Priestia filamentosa]WCM17064.1 MFS transporter [Priestia filamentosa]WRU96476.1 MFS transporter [Priestia filamentosa]